MVQRPEVIRISRELIPENSTATTAARVVLGDGSTEIIEMFVDDSGRTVDFRGLPDHLGNDGDMFIQIQRQLGEGACSLYGAPMTPQERAGLDRRMNGILFEFAIGSRQELWPGAQAVYLDESRNPNSSHYQPLR